MMEELDLLKKDWKRNANSYEQLSEVVIYKMLHMKSSSIVKWILVISILEVLFWTFINVFYDFDTYLRKNYGENLIGYFKFLTFFNYAVVAFFIYLFYRNYIRISTITSTKQLMKDILRTRKTVQYYVWYQLIMVAISMIIGFFISFEINPEIHKALENQKVYVLTLVICFFAIVFFVTIFWLFYKLVYGILLRRLFNNYKELKKIDL